MRIAFHFREHRAGNYSIEAVFGAVSARLSERIAVTSHVMRRRYDITTVLAALRGPDAVHHITGDIHYAALALPRERTVLTIHDLGSLTNDPPGLKRWIYRKMWYDIPCQRVSIVTTVSQFSKGCILATLGLHERDVRVIHDPLLPGFAWREPVRNTVPVILQIGSLRNKNVSRLVEAVRGLNVKLILVNHLVDPVVVKKLKQYKINYDQRVGLSREELAGVYAEADLVFFASTYEGFGMPIIEAQAVGRPVITSQVAAMPEIAGDSHRLLVDPTSVDQIRTAIVRTIEDRQLRDQVVSEGLENVKRFSLDRIAEQYMGLYAEVESGLAAAGS